MKLSFHGADQDVTGSCHLVEAAGKRVLVDCGMFQGGREERAMNAHDFGFDPASIDLVVNSHLHFDHCAGNALLPNARIVVQKREVEAARTAGPPKEGFDPLTMLDGRDVLEVDGEHDLFGDGAAVLLPTYGHTAGHQSLKLACDGGDAVLAGDCCYFHRTLSDLKLPGFAHDRDEQLRSIARLKALADGGARIVAGHDPDQWAQLPRAPAPLFAG
jgi:glyoxylase-like metal-dependent hydrolase (beta-lactamase superfamily II)